MKIFLCYDYDICKPYAHNREFHLDLCIGQQVFQGTVQIDPALEESKIQQGLYYYSYGTDYEKEIHLCDLIKSNKDYYQSFYRKQYISLELRPLIDLYLENMYHINSTVEEVEYNDMHLMVDYIKKMMLKEFLVKTEKHYYMRFMKQVW